MGTTKTALQTGDQPPPCEVFACDMYKTCGEQKKACWSFLNYVQYGEARDPHLERIKVKKRKFAHIRHNVPKISSAYYDRAMSR